MNTRNRYTGCALGAFALLAATGLRASASHPDHAERDDVVADTIIERQYNAVVRSNWEPDEPVRRQIVTMTKRERDGQTYMLRLSDGKAVAFLNGREIPAASIKRDGGEFVILGPNGDEAARFEVQVDAQFDDDNVVRGWVLRNDDLAAAGERRQAPPVMLGITMGSVSDEAARLLGLDPSQVTKVTRVIEGLPAEKAGIRGGDLILELEGRPNASRAALLEALQKKLAGDPLSVTVLRDGETKTLQVFLAPFDSDRLNRGVGVGPDAPFEMLGRVRAPDAPNAPDFPGQQRIIEEQAQALVEREMARAKAQLKRAEELLAQQEGKAMIEIERLRREELERRGFARLPDVDGRRQRELERRGFAPQRNNEFIFRELPQAQQSVERMETFDRRIDRLEERLSAFEARLEGMMLRMERILDRLDG